MRCHWDEDDIWFYFEVDAAGRVTRQVELQGPERTPVTAACRDEDDGRFGMTAEPPVHEWEGHDPRELTAGEFEKVWESARRRLAASP